MTAMRRIGRAGASLDAAHVVAPWIDPLTGLPDRAAFEDRLTQAAASFAVSGAVVVIVVDQMERVVDALGPSAADEVLCTTALRLRSLVEDGDRVLARLTSGGFAVFMSCSADGTEQITAFTDTVLGAIGEPMSVIGQELLLSASAGVALAGGSSRATADEVLRNAAVAAHRVQHAGGGRTELFSHDDRPGLREELRMESELRHALAGSDSLTLFFQPIVALDDASVVAVEALPRWEHPRHGLRLPPSFLDIAERAGILCELDRWRLDEACAQLARWREELGAAAPPAVSVNVSGDALAEGRFATDVAAALRRHALDGSALVLEVSQGALRHLAGSVTELAAARALGVRVLLDDFGSGHSSLMDLRRLPIDGLKIDRGFVEDAATSDAARAIVEGVVDIGRAMGLAVVAVGVETAEQMDLVRALGVTAAQGLHLLGPVPAHTLIELFSLSEQRMCPPGAALPVGNRLGAARVEPVHTMSLGQAAEMLSISPSTLRRWADDGRVTSLRTRGGHRRFEIAELRRIAPQTEEPRLRRAPYPNLTAPVAAALLDSEREELVRTACRATYVGAGGWFGSDQARAPLGAWCEELARALRGGSYLSLADAQRALAAKASPSTTVAEQHAFIDSFGRALRRRLIEGPRASADARLVAQAFRALTQQVLDPAER